MFEPSAQAKSADDLLRADPFLSDKAKEQMIGLSKDELTWLSLSFGDYAYNKFYWDDDLDSSLHPENDSQIENAVADMEERLCTLISMGLDPNHVLDEENPIWFFQYTLNEHYLNARLLRILLEQHGNPNINPYEDDLDDLNLYEYITQKILFDDEGRDRAIPYLMMLAAYGGKNRYGNNYFILKGDHKIEEFKEIEKLDWTYECTKREKEKSTVTEVIIHIFNRTTKEEIACFK